jgi:hypothetical protein
MRTTLAQVIRTIPRERLGSSFLFAMFLVLSAELATPWLSTIPAAYSMGGENDDDGGNGGDDDGKVTLCHIPPSNPEKYPYHKNK